MANLEYAKAYQDYANEAGRKHQEAAQEISRKCGDATVPPGVVTECLEKEIIAYQAKDTTNKDLEAQQEMAFWARMMVYVGAVGIPISIVGLVALVASLAQTRIAINVSDDTEIISQGWTGPYHDQKPKQ